MMHMNREMITLHEALNDGRSIYFYQEEASGVWVSYGYSAYLLSRMSGVNILSSFSELMQMPCVCITNADFRSIVKSNMSTIECRDGYYHLPTNQAVDDDKYKHWTNSLKS